MLVAQPHILTGRYTKESADDDSRRVYLELGLSPRVHSLVLMLLFSSSFSSLESQLLWSCNLPPLPKARWSKAMQLAIQYCQFLYHAKTKCNSRPHARDKYDVATELKSSQFVVHKGLI